MCHCFWATVQGWRLLPLALFFVGGRVHRIRLLERALQVGGRLETQEESARRDRGGPSLYAWQTCGDAPAGDMRAFYANRRECTSVCYVVVRSGRSYTSMDGTITRPRPQSRTAYSNNIQVLFQVAKPEGLFAVAFELDEHENDKFAAWLPPRVCQPQNRDEKPFSSWLRLGPRSGSFINNWRHG
ncbi:hypothetical protein BJY00DRAFT_84348 [Aspergillus carlsbadensis]|nr:hypothetical protein BJY00DRAFT_84348 [Aspergillus carlsbadensis]